MKKRLFTVCVLAARLLTAAGTQIYWYSGQQPVTYQVAAR
jgi:hypothetical protein